MGSILLTAVSALAGGFFGAFLTRQTQHHKWLLERRAEAFSEFLNEISHSYITTSDLIHDKELEEPLLGIKIHDAYAPTFRQRDVVRLYLPKDRRKEFFEHVQHYWVLHGQKSLGDGRILKMQEHLDAIQRIFEEELEEYFWLRPLLERIKRLTSR